jgi:ABC-type lipoprotein export system ATPase subunit
MSLIPSQFLFFDNLRVKDNLTLPIYLAGKSKKEIKTRLEYLLETFSFHDSSGNLDKISLKFLMKKKIKELSNGQKEIVSICRALLVDAPFILADEMLRSFNEEFERVVWEAFTKIIRKENKGVLLITHKEHLKNYSEVDRVIRIKDKKLIEEQRKGGGTR